MTGTNTNSLAKEAVMKRFSIVSLSVVVLALAFGGCNEAGPDVDRVQTSLVDKSIFQGEWWYTQATVDVDGDEANSGGGFVWEGGNAYVDLGRMDTFAIPRIRWVIDEDYLYAYRGYELISGANEDGRDEDYRGQPLAVFAISRHVDLRYDYDPVSGERSNVRVEDGTDRRWYEREYMYVDWSQNLVSSFYGVVMSVDYYSMDSAPFFFEAGAHEEFPKAWEPQFVRIGEDPEYRFADEWPAEEQDTVHYMSFVTQYMVTPGAYCAVFYRGGGQCQTTASTVRHSFLRIPPRHEYAAATQTHQEFDRFGLFRAEGRTFIRGNVPNDEIRRACSEDLDCGTGGTCADDGVCRGGLARSYGETDYLDFFRPRYNIWTDHLREDADCFSDWECRDVAGSQCDPVARKCTVPMADRPMRKVVYHLNQGYPKHLIRPAIESVWNWNEVFMAGHRTAQNRALPSGERVACQDEDPTGYCFCSSPESQDGTCAYKRDLFQSPEDAAAAGAVDPYQCHVQIAAPEPAHPTSWDDYPDEMYQFEFVGDECAFVLAPNSCDADPTAPCEQQGDLRYQFFNYIQHGQVRFGGVAEPLMDPTTGELIISDANMASESAESVSSLATRWFPALRCSGPAGCAPGEEGADVEYTEGESVRRYFSAQGQTWHPQMFHDGATDGYTLPDDGPRPTGLPADAVERLDMINARIAERLPRIERLQGMDGRAAIFSDRLRSLAGTPIETELLSTMELEAIEATQEPLQVRPDVSITDHEMLDQLSPMRGASALDFAAPEHRLWQKLARYNMDPPAETRLLAQRQGYWQYWAEAFRGMPLAEAAIRLQQMYVRGVMHHELGHCVGERHNYASSFDRDNYYDGALNVMFDHPLPNFDDYDTPGLGGNADGFVGGEEVTNYYRDLREVRDARAASGMHNFTSGSVMEYAGDLSDFNNDLGRYDRAVVWWNQWDLVEGFDAYPLHRSSDTLNEITRSHEISRTLFKSYRGGERCDVASDCPFSAESGAMDGQPITQRCILNPRESRLPIPCDGADNCVCSPFTEDFLDYVAGVPEYNNDADGDGELDHYPVNYLFCGDERGNDISWCTAFDAGESFQEAIDHYRRAWYENYPRSYYRQFRRGGPRLAASVGSIVQAVKIYQHFFFRYYYEPGFSSDPGPLGANDQIFASIDTMNWLAEMLNLPDTGSYELDSAAGVYRRIGGETGMPGSDVDLAIGQGFPMWSQRQEGYSGFFRLERGGVFMDKWYALYGLANRDWGLSFTVDERFYINFYDLWDTEMMELFGGIVLDEPRWFAPRVVMDGSTPNIQHLSWDRGTLFGACSRDGWTVPCRGSQDDVYTAPALDGTTNLSLRDWAAIFALAQFPVYYDTTFEQRAIIYKQDSGEGWSIPNTQPDGSATCAYGSHTVDPSHTTGCTAADADYVVFESERFHTPYIAVKVRSRIAYNLEEEQLSFQLLRRAVDLQTEVQALRALPSPTPAQLEELRQKEDELVRSESFIERMMYLQRQFGISGIL